ncbi:hypothetical protein GCM10020220_027030 [Nonomuraea rubra]|uniref:hypothetical protein n=1 Tax=Nonomuraea rubra TaxID=46180 RepID=UPI0031E58755
MLLTAVRSGHFQEKAEAVLDAARGAGVYPVFGDSADTPLPMIATRDVGRVAAEALLSPPSAGEVIDLDAPAYTERQVAESLAAVLGRPLQVVTIPQSQWVDTMVEAGLPPQLARELADMYAAVDRAACSSPPATVGSPARPISARPCAAWSRPPPDAGEIDVPTIVMTGGTSGFGAITAERLARSKGVRLILGARHPSTADGDPLPPGRTVAGAGMPLVSGRTAVGGELLPLELAELASVRAFAAAVRRAARRCPPSMRCCSTPG